MAEYNGKKTIKQLIDEINTKIGCIDEKLKVFQQIEIKVTNGKEKIVTYRRNEFFQMLYDRGTVWKEKARITARDVMLFGGVFFLIIDKIFKIIK